MSGRATHRTFPRRSACVAAAGAMVLAAVVVIPAQAQTRNTSGTGLVGRSSGVLSARLAQLATPNLQSASVTERARALSLPTTGGGSLSTDNAGRVAVLVNLKSTSTATIDQLKALGTVLNVSTTMSRATLQINPAQLGLLAASPNVRFADLIYAPLLASSYSADTSAVSHRSSRSGKVVCNPVKSESDVQLRAALARVNSKVNGSGVTIGVLSDSYDTSTSTTIDAAQDVKAGELPGVGNPCGFPTPVKVLADGQDGLDEGRAMLQSIHDLAPGSRLMFATADGGEDVMAANILKLARAGAKVIVDDASYYTEPFFQSGAIDQAISTVTTKYGVSYFSAAGNGNVIYQGHNVSSWETSSAVTTTCPKLLNSNISKYDPRDTQCVSFGGYPTYQLTIAPGGIVYPLVQWAEPFNGVSDDYNVYLIDKNTSVILADSEDDQAYSGAPSEPYGGWQNESGRNETVQIVIVHDTQRGLPGAAVPPRLKMIFATLTGFIKTQFVKSTSRYVLGPSIFGHDGGPDTISVAAVPYNNSRSPEFYSSRGPVTRYFGPVTGTAAAKLIPPQIINAPSLTATDGNATSFFGNMVNGVHRFYGTSDAAPNAAAVAALLRSLHPRITAAQVKSMLQTFAAPVGTQPATAVGAGLVDALAALAGTRQLGRPGAATAIQVAPARGRVTLHFRAPTNTGHLRIINYTATCFSAAPLSATRSVTFAGGAVEVVGLTPGRTYRCLITATNVLGSQRSASSVAFKA